MINPNIFVKLDDLNCELDQVTGISLRLVDALLYLDMV